MYQLAYDREALSDLEKLDSPIADRITKKIAFYTKQENPLEFAKPLKGFGPNKYRFRIGDFRAIFKISENGEIQILMILRIKHRKDIYFG